MFVNVAYILPSIFYESFSFIYCQSDCGLEFTINVILFESRITVRAFTAIMPTSLMLKKEKGDFRSGEQTTLATLFSSKAQNLSDLM